MGGWLWALSLILAAPVIECVMQSCQASRCDFRKALQDITEPQLILLSQFNQLCGGLIRVAALHEERCECGPTKSTADRFRAVSLPPFKVLIIGRGQSGTIQIKRTLTLPRSTRKLRSRRQLRSDRILFHVSIHLLLSRWQSEWNLGATTTQTFVFCLRSSAVT